MNAETLCLTSGQGLRFSRFSQVGDTRRVMIGGSMAEWADVEEIVTYEDAIQVVLQGIGMRVDPRKVLWCNYPILWHNRNEFEGKIKKDTKKLEKELEDELSPKRLWYVGVPEFKLIRRGIPHLACDIDLYYAACDTSTEYWSWYGRILPKADRFEVPLCLMSALARVVREKDLEVDGANIIERGLGYIIYDFRGREWKIPDAFLGFVSALAEKGNGFEGLLDPFSCELMNRFAKELPTADVPKLPSGDGYELIVSGLKQMGFPKAQAEEAARVGTDKFPSSTLEEKVKQALKYLGG